MTLGDKKLNFKKLLSVFLCITLLISIFSNALFVIAEEINNKDIVMIGTITEPGTNKVGVIIRPDAKREGRVITIADETIVTVTGSKNDLYNEKNSATNKTYIWYAVTYTNGGKTYSGYVREDMITVTKYTIDKTFEEQLSDFPKSYHEALTILHAQYPNWAFQADKINITFNEAIALESVYPRKLIMDRNAISWASMGDGWYNWSTGVFATADANLKGASREVIAYYMDPRNFLNPNDIFIFMKQSYDAASQNIEGVKKIIAGRKLFENYNDPNDTDYGGDFAAVIMEAGKQSGVSPYILASTIIQEQGSEGNALAKGYDYNGTVVYNFFNVKASGNSSDQIIKNGASYAYNQGWTTRSAAIIGGAKFYGNSYLNRGNSYNPVNPYYNQDTYFYKNYNILDKNKISHQYAQNVADSLSSAKNLRSLYTTDYTTQLVFRIPVYANDSLPKENTFLPENNTKLNNYYLNSIVVDGLTPSFTRYEYNYALRVEGDTTVQVDVPDKATLVSATTYPLVQGDNTVKITVKSETGFTNDYIISVNATTPCQLTLTTGAVKPPRLLGDVDGNGKITISDLVLVRMHLLELTTLKDDNKTAADTDVNGKITISDLVLVRMHLLELVNLNKK